MSRAQLRRRAPHRSQAQRLWFRLKAGRSRGLSGPRNSGCSRGASLSAGVFKRHYRRSLRPALHRLRHPRGAGCLCARAYGSYELRRNHRFGLAHGPLRPTEAARGLLLPARLSLLLLPFVTDFAGLSVFAIFFGLDYIATVPPTVTLVADRFGRMNVGAVFGWVFFTHQVGAALAAYLGGVTLWATTR
jgi:hypothetical protein